MGYAFGIKSRFSCSNVICKRKAFYEGERCGRCQSRIRDSRTYENYQIYKELAKEIEVLQPLRDSWEF